MNLNLALPIPQINFPQQVPLLDFNSHDPYPAMWHFKCSRQSILGVEIQHRWQKIGEKLLLFSEVAFRQTQPRLWALQTGFLSVEWCFLSLPLDDIFILNLYRKPLYLFWDRKTMSQEKRERVLPWGMLEDYPATWFLFWMYCHFIVPILTQLQTARSQLKLAVHKINKENTGLPI